jgi:hypothetical protein
MAKERSGRVKERYWRVLKRRPIDSREFDCGTHGVDRTGLDLCMSVLCNKSTIKMLGSYHILLEEFLIN